MKLLLITLIIFFCMTGISCNHKDEIYVVNKADHRIEIDGLFTESVWEKANIISEFIYPWEDKEVQGRLIFRALYDNSTFYFSFVVEDKNAFIVLDSLLDKKDISKEERVEIYFSKNKTLKEYFCIEIDPKGRILDYKASFYRKFDESWFLKGAKCVGEIFVNRYQIEAAIPLEFLNEMGIDYDEDFFVGLFRADLKKLSNSSISESWISWIDPKTNIPDFHVPEAFGVFRFSH